MAVTMAGSLDMKKVDSMVAVMAGDWVEEWGAVTVAKTAVVLGVTRVGTAVAEMAGS